MALRNTGHPPTARLVVALAAALVLSVLALGGAAAARELVAPSPTETSDEVASLTEEEMASVLSVTTRASDGYEEPCDVTLDLDGGTLSGLAADGWIRGTELDTWSKEVEQGAQITLANPVRDGYTFLGWIVDGNGPSQSPITASDKNLSIKADWKLTSYSVTFEGASGQQLGCISVPYGSILWTSIDQPWESAEFGEDNTTTVNITLDGALYTSVTVTKHEEDTTPSMTWYSFSLESDAAAVSYFAFGGEVQAPSGQSFSYWKKTQGGTGYQVLGDTVFSAQFAQDPSYVINVHYRTSDGLTLGASQTIVKGEKDLEERKLTVTFDVPNVSHYSVKTVQAYSADGSTVGNGVTITGSDSSRTATIDVGTVFPGDAAQANYLSIVVEYEPEEVSYVVEYYQENVDKNDYDKVIDADFASNSVRYGSIVEIPVLNAEKSEGFVISGQSRLALLNGVELVEPETEDGDITWDAVSKRFTIKIYYNRASYFVYPMLDSTELATSPQKVTYGGRVSQTIFNPRKTGYTFARWVWYRLGDNGKLVTETDADGKPIDYLSNEATMPAYDLYAVAQWTPVEVQFQVVLWLEDADSPSFSNVYQEPVNSLDVKAGDKVTVSIGGDELVISNAYGNEKYQSSSLLKDYVEGAYGTDSSIDYTQFFSYSAERTKLSPGNIALAEEAGGVVNGGQLGSSFEAVVGADGTTSINVYYTRNLYTVEMVLARQSGYATQVATNTPGSFGGSSWTNLGGSVTGFSNAGLEDLNGIDSSGWDENAVTVYGDAALDYADANANRYPVSRYGQKTVNGYSCTVYQITAKFEASVDAFWPTADDLAFTSSMNYKYISLGTDGQSYYRNVFTGGSSQHNILNVYGRMDANVLLMESNGAYTATQCGMSGDVVSHQMIAYWYWNSGVFEYQYYFLKEVLDTSIAANDPRVTPFSASSADGGEYKNEKQKLVSLGDTVYEFSAQAETQYSTAVKSGQNQPSLKGFVSKGAQYSDTGNEKGGNIYFFYQRERYTLTLTNVSEEYSLPESAWGKEYENKTLYELGWEKNDGGSVTLRYGASLAPLGDVDFMDYLTGLTAGGLTDDKLEYPIATTGESQRYFTGWYLNAKLSVAADWSVGSSLLDVSGNVGLYAGWSTPRYTTSYVLNGGTWQDNIDYTLVTAEIPVSSGSNEKANVFLAYPHQVTDNNAVLSWYVQTQAADRLYIDQLYETTLSEVMYWDDATNHWHINADLTLDYLQDKSKPSSESSFTGQYFCYMAGGGSDESYSHKYYVNVNTWLGETLAKPVDPVRNGYRFEGWYEFDPEPDPATNPEKVYLSDALLGSGESTDAYRRNHVYLDETGDAFILHADNDGSLFYYPGQTGYRVSFENGASTVTATKEVYAAWSPKSDVEFHTLHLAEKSEVNDAGVKKLGVVDIDEKTKTITLSSGGTSTEYYVLADDSQTVNSGQLVEAAANASYVDNKSKVWMPDEAARKVNVTDSTQTATKSATDNTVELSDAEAGCYRLADSGSGDGYAYYTYFVYKKTEQIQYTVYGINLSLAVANGALSTFEDVFDRANPPAATEPYVISREVQTFAVTSSDTTVTVSAPDLSGWTVYRDTTQQLALATDATTNNVYFYYVAGDGSNRYSITYHVMHDGSYETGWTATVSNIPAADGETLSKSQLVGLYDSLVRTAYLVDDYSGADAGSNEGKLYARYKDMTVTLKEGTNGSEQNFTVGGSGSSKQLSQTEALAFNDGTVYDGHNPVNDVLVIKNGDNVDVYLKNALLTVNKVDWTDAPLAGCEFSLQRLVLKDDADSAVNTYLYDADGDGTPEEYVVDGTASTIPATSDASGRAVFYNLYADDKHVYLLTETSCPEGYAPLREPVLVAVPQEDADGNMVYAVAYTIKNNGVVELPVAGAFGGVYLPLLAGGACVAAATLIARRQRRG